MEPAYEQSKPLKGYHSEAYWTWYGWEPSPAKPKAMVRLLLLEAKPESKDGGKGWGIEPNIPDNCFMLFCDPFSALEFSFEPWSSPFYAGKQQPLVSCAQWVSLRFPLLFLHPSFSLVWWAQRSHSKIQTNPTTSFEPYLKSQQRCSLFYM